MANSRNDTARFILAGTLLTTGLMIPAAQAQTLFSRSAPIHPGPKPILLQSGGAAAVPSAPGVPNSLIDPGPIGIATTTNLFAQIAIGGGYTTSFTFLNTGSDTTTGNLILTGDDGQPLNASLSSAGIGVQSPETRISAADAPLVVPPGGTQFVSASAADPNDPNLKVGWARVESEGGSLAGVATFQFVINNKLATIAGVLSAAATGVATIPIDDDGTLGDQSFFTGYGVANPGDSDMNIKLILVGTDGNPIQTLNPPSLNPLPAHQHVAKFLFQDLNNNNFKFKGSVVFIEQSAKPFSVVALVLKGLANPLYTTIPVVPAKAAHIQ